MLVASALSSLFSMPLVACATPQPLPGAFQASQASIFGEPVVVDGRRIPDDEIQRLLCFGVGNIQVEMLKFGVLIDEEMQRRKDQELDSLVATEAARRTAAGQSPDLDEATLAALRKTASDTIEARFKIDDAYAARRLQADREEFLLKYPTLDFAAEVSRAFLSVDLYKEHAKARLLFDNLFLPENPDEWSELTMTLIVNELSEGWVNDSRISYEARLKRQKEEGLPDIPPDDPIATETQRQTILEALEGYALIVMDPDEIEAALPEAGPDSPSDPAARAAARKERARNTLLLVQNVPIPMEAVWSRIAPYVTPDQVEDAKRFLVCQALLERELAGRKVTIDAVERPALMSPAEFREWWPTTSRREGPVSYHQHLMDQRMLSQQVLGFPSLYAFENYQRLFESYRRAIADDLKKDELLAPIMPMATQIAGASKLSCEVILLSAFDFVNVRWKPNGWADAKRRATELKAQLDGGADWTAMLELHSEFWDPPLPEVGHKPQYGFLFKGKFGQQTRNTLTSYMGESEYRTFLYGPSISDYMFFEQKMGTTDGPFRGPKGYYITRTSGRTPPSKPLDLKQPTHRQIVEHYYLRDQFNRRLRELFDGGIAKGTITGVAAGGGIRDL